MNITLIISGADQPVVDETIRFRNTLERAGLKCSLHITDDDEMDEWWQVSRWTWFQKILFAIWSIGLSAGLYYVIVWLVKTYL